LQTRKNHNSFQQLRLFNMALALKTKDISNRRKQLCLGSTDLLAHTNDADAVSELVNTWKRDLGDDSPVRYFKQVGQANDSTDDTSKKSDFKSDDFILVMQTQEQAEMMKTNQRIICVDATHGLTAYDYSLLSIVVVDKYGHGLVCATAICSRENGVFWELVGKALRPEGKQIVPEVLMSDDTNSAWNGLKKVWPSLKYKLLCLWHVKRNVRKKCLACQGPSTSRKTNSTNNKKTPSNTSTNDKEEEASTAVATTNRTYGLSTWEFFVILLEEKNERLFYTYLRAFRDNLKRHKLDTLSAYFEEHYFQSHRIKQWARWYRLQMFDCEWLLDTNMHTESWHNQLKTSIMERVKNHRVDELMKIIRKAETMYYCKWARTQIGVRQLADPTWLTMRGETGSSPTESPTSRPSVMSCPEPDWNDFVHKEETERSTNYKKVITEVLLECLSLMKTKDMEPLRLKAIVKTSRSIRNALRNSPESSILDGQLDGQPQSCNPNPTDTDPNPTDTDPATVTRGETVSYKSLRKKKKKKMSPVKPKYKVKKKNKYANVTNVKALVKNADTRQNLATSFLLNAVGWSSLKTPTTFPALSVLKLRLGVIKRGRHVSLGGIIFMPMMAGVVVKDGSGGFDSLNVRVHKARIGSPAHLKGATSQHYLHKIRTVKTLKSGRSHYGVMRVVGSREFRSTYTNIIKFDELLSSIDDMITDAYVDNNELEITLVSYIK